MSRKEAEEMDVIVVGGGASGLMAAGQAAACGARTLILEKMDRPGRKLRITGKGRCNLTNDTEIPEFLSHFGDKGLFLRNVFHRFFVADLISFFHEHGLPTVVERGGRVFPSSGRAQDVLDTLVQWAESLGVSILHRHAVRGLVIRDGRVQAVSSLSHSRARGSGLNKDGIIRARAVILATGGASYPATGSTGDGYRIAGACGHRIVPVRPALVPLETAVAPPVPLQGLTLRNILVRLFIDGRIVLKAFGEMTFTPFGVSGPVVLTLSRDVVDGLDAGSRVVLAMDLKPALDTAKLDARLIRDLTAGGRKPLHNLLSGLMPRALIPLCLEQAGIPGYTPCSRVTSNDRARLRAWLKDFRMEIIGYRPFDEAIITAGGVDLSEIDPRTMASRICKGLYFAGEIMDVDADTGGYNLQAAFSTGWLAGRSAAVSLKPKNDFDATQKGES